LLIEDLERDFLGINRQYDPWQSGKVHRVWKPTPFPALSQIRNGAESLSFLSRLAESERDSLVNIAIVA
jgi:hypothetical protein